VTIDGQTLSDCIQGQKYKFMIQYSQGEGQVETDDIAFCGVEEVVLDHYKHNGFTDGMYNLYSIPRNRAVMGIR
jgi:hypothetical protein